MSRRSPSVNGIASTACGAALGFLAYLGLLAAAPPARSPSPTAAAPAVATLNLVSPALPASADADASPPGPTAGVETHVVDHVVDGDTVVLLVEGKATKFRLVGVDTPETVHPNKPVERFGKEASAFLKEFLDGVRVYVERDPAGDQVDRYGRQLAYLHRASDGLDVNREIIRRGFGHAYVKYPFARLDDYRAAEREARQAQAGLWKPEATDLGADAAAPPPTASDAAAARPLVDAPAPAARSYSGSSSASSGTCGAMTKKGAPCRRRVKGGGYCYQHR